MSLSFPAPARAHADARDERDLRHRQEQEAVGALELLVEVLEVAVPDVDAVREVLERVARLRGRRAIASTRAFRARAFRKKASTRRGRSER